jgi:hypothetical protein
MGTPMKNFMIDIETLDTENTAAVISIGAVVFDPDTAEVEDRVFHMNIDFEDALTHGTHSEGTIKFWERQPAEAQATLFEPAPVSLEEALKGFSKYVKSWGTPKPKFIWGNSPSFDVAILRHACKQTGQKFPFTPWVEMDVRTLKNLMPKELIPSKEGVNHSAVDDCLWQCKIVQIFHGVEF